MTTRTPRRLDLSALFTWLTGAALALDLLLIVGLLVLVAVRGAGALWPHPVWSLGLADGTRVLGEIHSREPIPDAETGRLGDAGRIRVRIGNRDVSGLDFRWIDETQVTSRETPRDAVLVERLEWGPFFGFPAEIRTRAGVVASGPDSVWTAFGPLHDAKVALRERLRDVERGAIGDVNHEIERVRLAERRLEREAPPEPARSERAAALAARRAELEARYETHLAELRALREELADGELVLTTADGAQHAIPLGQIVRASQPNALGLGGKLSLYADRIAEFVGGQPREANTEGGIFPALFGTVMMVFLMSLFVVPFGVVAAIYLREYAREGFVTRAIRIAVNNLAGVPSIVFGVFGLGFFVYGVGGSIDRLFFADALPTPTFGTGGILWASLTLSLLTVPVVIVATEEGLAAVPQAVRQGSRALGATHFETLRRVVIPAAAPGMLTGLILAMARAAGEVAPLMIVGMVKLAPTLPIDHHPPFVHLERKFMHLGFHIYDVGFQSPNVEAAAPLVFATTALLIAIVVSLNLTAIVLRNRLRRQLAGRGV
ncbi:MAG: phosphate ABC transporter permease PtsA [Proteobacteria bacterium]|nr:MAG: phosphate ABC transporter permease PtsA [Pseudomonadota bacterium]